MDAEPRDYTFADRELSWLSFNERVLQEAADPRVPLFERIGFLAIFSSNLDEFFRVRVASLRALLRLKKKKAKRLAPNPRKLLRQIHAVVSVQQTRFGKIFQDAILPALREQGIFLVDETAVSEEHHAFLEAYFDTHVRPLLDPRRLAPHGQAVFLEDRTVYLLVEVWPEGDVGLDVQPDYHVVRVPSELARFVTPPATDGRHEVLFLDDVIRFNLPRLFPGRDPGRAYAVKLSRDADLYLNEVFAGDVVEAIRKSLSKRKTGAPARFLYDLNAPYGLVSFAREIFALEDDDLILGGRYHNLHDLHAFPRFGLDRLAYPRLEGLLHPVLGRASSVLGAVRAGDQVIHPPYQRYDPVVRFLEEAARDPAVEEIWITVYRVSGESAVLQALLDAAEAGKRVRVFLEVKARFDEAANLRWGERLEAAGISTLYSFADLKVHAKLALVGRREGTRVRYYAYLATGNFNEKTARVYCDHGLFTADPRIGEDVRAVFAYLSGENPSPTFRHLLVAPFTLRSALYDRIDREIAHAQAGRPAGMVLKMNSLEDTDIIRKLYEASNAGVPVRLIVRGICRLIPGVPGQSERIDAISIVDRYLEHARVFVFRNGGDDAYFLASADWMHRNLSRRVEVAVPVFDPGIRRQLGRILDLQWADTEKARILDAEMSNRAARATRGGGVRAQVAIREYLAGLVDAPSTPSSRGSSAEERP